MAELRVRWTQQAVQDLDSAQQYLTLENTKAVKIILDRLLKSIEQIRLYPESGRSGRVTNTLELVIPKTQYILIYRYKSKIKEIQILSFLHSSRKWP